MPAEREDLLPPVAALRREADRVVASAPYSADLAQQLKDSLPAQDYRWNAEKAEWEIAPEHEATVQRILDEVAEENSWNVQAIQQTGDFPGGSPRSAPVGAIGDQEAALITEANYVDETLPDTPIEPTKIDFTGSQAFAPLPAEDDQQNTNASLDKSPEPAESETQPASPVSALHPPTGATPAAATPTPRPAQSGRVSTAVAGSIQAGEREPVEKATEATVPDAAQSAPPPETPRS
jgi:hypothetical protein